jgi:hypothetical protein
LGFWIFITLFTWRRLKQPGHVSQNEILLHLIIDIAMLTALLAVSGGPANPLTALYLPPIAVAAAVLPVKFAGLTITLSVMAYSLLWKFSLPLTVEDVDRAMQMHLTGMWLTFAPVRTADRRFCRSQHARLAPARTGTARTRSATGHRARASIARTNASSPSAIWPPVPLTNWAPPLATNGCHHWRTGS